MDCNSPIGFAEVLEVAAQTLDIAVENNSPKKNHFGFQRLRL
jgi:hypothetical protein